MKPHWHVNVVSITFPLVKSSVWNDRDSAYRQFWRDVKTLSDLSGASIAATNVGELYMSCLLTNDDLVNVSEHDDPFCTFKPNDEVAKILPIVSNEVTDGSVPCTPEYVERIQRFFRDIAELAANIVIDIYEAFASFVRQLSYFYEEAFSIIASLAKEIDRVTKANWRTWDAKFVPLKEFTPSTKWQWVKPERPTRRIYERYNVRFYTKIRRTIEPQ